MVEHERTGPRDLIVWSISRVTVWLPPCIVAIIFFEVLMRYVFGNSTMWVNETSLWGAGAVYMFAGLYSMQQRSHIRIHIPYDLAPLWSRRTFDVISTICIAIFAVALIWGNYDDAVRKFMTWERFGTQFAPLIPATLKPLILITMALLALQAISNFIYDWNTEQGEKPLVEDMDDLLARVGTNYLDARPTGEAADHTNTSGNTPRQDT